jgi:hypothetical protein
LSVSVSGEQGDGYWSRKLGFRERGYHGRKVKGRVALRQDISSSRAHERKLTRSTPKRFDDDVNPTVFFCWMRAVHEERKLRSDCKELVIWAE